LQGIPDAHADFDSARLFGTSSHVVWINLVIWTQKMTGYVPPNPGIYCLYWQDLHDDDKTCMQLSYWELILENGQWLGCWITDRLCALPVTNWTGIHGFGYLSPLIRIAPFSAHKLIRLDTQVLHQAIIV
jgi:hypothetical protein